MIALHCGCSSKEASHLARLGRSEPKPGAGTAAAGCTGVGGVANAAAAAGSSKASPFSGSAGNPLHPAAAAAAGLPSQAAAREASVECFAAARGAATLAGAGSDGGYYHFEDVLLTCSQPSEPLTQAPSRRLLQSDSSAAGGFSQSPGNIAAVVLGSVLGVTLFGVVIPLLVYLFACNGAGKRSFRGNVSSRRSSLRAISSLALPSVLQPPTSMLHMWTARLSGEHGVRNGGGQADGGGAGAGLGAAAGGHAHGGRGYEQESEQLMAPQREGGKGAGVVGGGRKSGQHKQAMFEEARRLVGQARHGAMAQKDNLSLESVLGEGTFGKVFKGKRGEMAMKG